MTRLKLLRLDRALSQWELSRRAGLAQGVYSLLERGLRPPTSAQRAALATALGVSPTGLFRHRPGSRPASGLRGYEPARATP